VARAPGSAFIGVEGIGIESRELDGSGIGLKKTSRREEQRRLSATASAADGHAFARGHFEVDILDSRNRAAGSGERFAESSQAKIARSRRRQRGGVVSHVAGVRLGLAERR
jgi:hypothetical protein